MSDPTDPDTSERGPVISQTMEGPYVNGMPDQKPRGYEIPIIEVEFAPDVQMHNVQQVVSALKLTMEFMGFKDIRIEGNFLQVADKSAPKHNRKG